MTNSLLKAVEATGWCWCSFRYNSTIEQRESCKDILINLSVKHFYRRKMW